VKSALAIITYRRLHALQAMMTGVEEHCAPYKTAIFEDCGQRDNTADFLQQGRTPEARRVLMATEYLPLPEDPLAAHYPNTKVFMGERNLGVAGNSNRALKWFMDSDADHLCLCNDDLLVTGDFVKAYQQAHSDLGIGMFCFCDFTASSPAISGPAETYKWVTYPWRGYKMKLLPRFTGIMMSVTRALIEKMGYFDAEFGQFGEEHCDFTIRARMAGGIQMDGQDMNCLDIEHDCLKHQDVTTSVIGAARQHANQEAQAIMQRSSFEYRFRHYYRPFRLVYPLFGGGYYKTGISCRQLEQIGYSLVSDLV
jgi:GT2 family glycosyltransferase